MCSTKRKSGHDMKCNVIFWLNLEQLLHSTQNEWHIFEKYEIKARAENNSEEDFLLKFIPLKP